MRVGKVDKRVLGPVLMGFFIMGFCDMVAPITGRIALEFPASRQAAVSFLPTMVFLWFLVLSTPLAALMNRIGRKATALIGYAFTVVGLMVPYVAGEGCALGWYFAGFGLLGVGNTAIQVAINPLLATIVPCERMTSYLTVGQIFRNTSLLLLAPIVTALVALTGSWRLLLPIYAGLTVQTLSDRLAEAATEKMHEYVRKEAWGYAKEENLGIADLLVEKYQGIRPAVGYPSLPDQSVNFLLDELLDMKQIGISLTENGAMYPHASVCGLMFSHPASEYFSVGKIGEDQLEDYTRRRGKSIEEMRKFLAANLQ